MAMWGVGVMVGPILGPTLGGYLTEIYNWRWVFYINLPFGILAFLGILGFVPETTRDRERPFDFFGFAMLSLAIGALQLMLDRGETKDWFGSTEIIIEAAIAGLGLYLFIVHMIDGRAAVPRAAAVQGPQLRRRPALHLRGRHRAAGDAGADAAVPAEPHGLSGAHHRAGAGAARHRHHDRDGAGRPAGRPGRCAPAHLRRPGGHRRSRCGRWRASPPTSASGRSSAPACCRGSASASSSCR